MATDTAVDPAKLSDELRGLGEKLNGLRSMERSDNVRADMRNTAEDIKILDSILLATQRAEEDSQRRQALKDYGNGPNAGTAQVDQRALTSGEQFTRSDSFKEWESRGHQGSVELEVRTLLSEVTTPAGQAGGLWLPVAQPLAPRNIRQRLFIRDLVSTVPTGLSHIPYLQETNNAADDALMTTVGEGLAKPELQMSFLLADSPVRKIAGWIPITTELLADSTTIRGYIDGRLDYMVRLREESQILNGNGTAPNLRGIRQTSGIQTQVDPATAGLQFDPIQMLGLALGKIEAVGGEADGIAMNPADYWSMVTARFANQMDGGFSTGSPFNAPTPTVWGVPVVRTPSMPAGVALAGSYAQGATVFDREQTTIRVGDQHSDFFTLNKVVILAEKREALAVFRPDFFCEVTFAQVG